MKARRVSWDLLTLGGSISKSNTDNKFVVTKLRMVSYNEKIDPQLKNMRKKIDLIILRRAAHPANAFSDRAGSIVFKS